VRYKLKFLKVAASTSLRFRHAGVSHAGVSSNRPRRIEYIATIHPTEPSHNPRGTGVCYKIRFHSNLRIRHRPPTPHCTPHHQTDRRAACLVSASACAYPRYRTASTCPNCPSLTGDSLMALYGTPQHPNRWSKSDERPPLGTPCIRYYR
jgi:hypothetical protein